MQGIVAAVAMFCNKRTMILLSYSDHDKLIHSMQMLLSLCPQTNTHIPPKEYCKGNNFYTLKFIPFTTLKCPVFKLAQPRNLNAKL